MLQRINYLHSWKYGVGTAGNTVSSPVQSWSLDFRFWTSTGLSLDKLSVCKIVKSAFLCGMCSTCWTESILYFEFAQIIVLGVRLLTEIS